MLFAKFLLFTELSEEDIEQAMLRELSWIAKKKGYQIYFKHRPDEEDECCCNSDGDWSNHAPNARNLLETINMKYRPTNFNDCSEDNELASDWQ